MEVIPIDVVEVIKAIFYGTAALCVPLATVYIMLAAARTKKTAEAVTIVKDELSKVKDNVELIERNTNSLTTQLKSSAHKNGLAEGEAIGEKRGEESARQLAQGQREGREIERASVAAAQATTAISSPSPAAGIAGHAGEDQVPVKDDRVATATERIAAATEKGKKS